MGAKLCGSGRGGNMIALVKEEGKLKVQDALITAGAIHTFFTQILPEK
jgi:mevalonate kinase